MWKSIFVAAIYVSFGLAEDVDCTSSRDAGYACADGTAQKFFYFDKRAKVCQPLFYKGCGGNANRYASAAECRNKCVGGSSGGGASQNGAAPSATTDGNNLLRLRPGHEQWTHATKCNAEFLIPNHNYTECPAGSCPANHTCTNGVCCPSKDYVCSLIDDNGIFEDGIEDKPRFGWSDKWKTCVRFSYYGANGNYNNFPSFPSCQKYCNPSNRN